MKVSFAITTHNEGECIERLLSQLQEHIEGGVSDEIIILDDFSTDPDTVTVLESYSNLPYVQLHRRALERDFGSHKSYLNTLCSGDYIFQIDADELLEPRLLENLHTMLEANPTVDLYLVPRINTVDGLTDEHIRMFGWQVTKDGWVMWPDYQTRLYRNSSDIMWFGKVHERIQGYDKFAQLPEDEAYSILHHKHITKQEEQNAFYSEILRDVE